MRIFISGGCKNGKSYFAQRLAKSQGAEKNRYYYIATMASTGAEDDERIARHRRDREGWGFETIEQFCDIEKVLDKCDTGASFLLDSVTALLANEMFPLRGGFNDHAAGKIIGGLLRVMESISNIVIVSDYIYGDAAIYDSLTERYRRALSEIDRAVAKGCDTVLEAVYSGIIVHKGSVSSDFDIRRSVPG